MPFECGFSQIVCEASNLEEMQDFLNSLKPRIIKSEITEAHFAMVDAKMTNMCINFLNTNYVKNIELHFKTSEIPEVWVSKYTYKWKYYL